MIVSLDSQDMVSKTKNGAVPNIAYGPQITVPLGTMLRNAEEGAAGTLTCSIGLGSKERSGMDLLPKT